MTDLPWQQRCVRADAAIPSNRRRKYIVITKTEEAYRRWMRQRQNH
jgi:hypothetical protein